MWCQKIIFILERDNFKRVNIENEFNIYTHTVLSSKRKLFIQQRCHFRPSYFLEMFVDQIYYLGGFKNRGKKSKILYIIYQVVKLEFYSTKLRKLKRFLTTHLFLSVIFIKRKYQNNLLSSIFITKEIKEIFWI